MDIIIDPLEKIKEISINCESVREYIDTQSYLMDTDCVDALDEVGILTQCYLILIDELKRKGIIFISDTDEILSSISEADKIFKLYIWIDTKNQIKFCKCHEKIIQILENIIENESEDLLHEWYNAYKLIDTNILEFESIFENIKSIEKFKDYLSFIFENVKDSVFEFTQPKETILAYINAMYSGQKDAKKAFKYLMKDPIFQQYMTTKKTNEILNYLNTYDVEKLQPPYISKYAWAWSIETNYNDAPNLEDLPDNIQEYYKQLEYEHHSTTDHHIEYYLVNNDVPLDLKAVLLLVVACYEPNKPSETKLAAENVLKYGGDRIPKDMKKLFIHFANQLIKLSKLDNKEI